MEGAGYCWGSANCENGTTICSTTSVPAGNTWTQISTGSFFACGVTTTNSTICWGDNLAGQTSVPAGLSWASVSAGYRFACGVLTNGTGRCWGANGKNQTVVPQNVLFKSISVGQTHACGILQDESLICWGDNNAGQTAGWGSMWGFPLNRTVSPSRSYLWRSISAGFFYNCGVLKNSTGVCWGYNGLAQTNMPHSFSHLWGYVQTYDTTKWLQISASNGWASTTCGINATTTALSCWGDDSNGVVTQIPKLITSWAAVTSPVAGGGHMCAIAADRSALCWGKCNLGQCNVSGFDTVGSQCCTCWGYC